MLAGAQVRRHLLLNDGVLRQFAQLLLRVRVSNRVVVRCRLVDLLYLPRVVFYVLEYLVRVLRFWIFLVLLADRARCWRHLGHLANHWAVNYWVADCRLLACALLVNHSDCVATLFVCALNGCQKFGVHRLHTRAIDSLNRSLNLTLVYFFEHIQGAVRNFCACRPFPIRLGGRLRGGVSCRLMGRGWLLIYAVFGEHIVQVRTLWRVVDHFETFLDFSACHYGLLARSCMQTWRTVRLSIVSTLALAAWISTNEVIDANDLDLGSVARVGAGTALADTAPLETSIEELLLPFERVLDLAQLKLLLLHQLLETVLEFLFELGLFLQWLGFPVFLFLFQVVNLLLEHLNV